MKNRTSFLSALVAAFVLLFAACGGGNKAVPVAGVALNKNSMNFTMTGIWEGLDADIQPKDATDKGIEWSSDNPSVARVTAKGSVMAYAPGTARITAKTNDGGFAAFCDVAVSESDVDIYVAGNEFTSGFDGRLPISWKNGVFQPLGDKGGTANSVAVPSGDVFAVGTETNEQGVLVAKLWKNGEAQNLGDGISHSRANSVFVSGDDVYAVGAIYRFDNEYTSTATVWKNGAPQALLTENGNNGYAISVFVSNGDVYVAGIYHEKDFGHSQAALWKNGTEQTLGGPDHFDGVPLGAAHAVSVSGTDVYVAGFLWKETGKMLNDYTLIHEVATVWKNGEPHYLSDDNLDSRLGEMLTSVFVTDDGDVYAAGYIFGEGGTVSEIDPDNGSGRLYTATLYKNGVAQDFDKGRHATEVFSVFVLDGDVYMAGCESDWENPDDLSGELRLWGRARLWINGDMKGFLDLIDDEHYLMEANSVVVKSKK